MAFPALKSIEQRHFLPPKVVEIIEQTIKRGSKTVELSNKKLFYRTRHFATEIAIQEVIQSACQAVGQSARQSVSQSARQSGSQPVSQSGSQSVSQSARHLGETKVIGPCSIIRANFATDSGLVR
jgi:hypothetical protein